MTRFFFGELCQRNQFIRKMKIPKNAEELPQEGVTTQTTDNTAASTGNSGTVKIGKGSDESCTINLTLTDSHFTVISNTGEGSSNVSSPRARQCKTATLSVKNTTTLMQTILKAFGVILALLSSITLLLSLRNTIVERSQRK